MNPHKKPKLNRFRLIIDDLAHKNKIYPEDHYFSTQEVIFTEIITDTKVINQRLTQFESLYPKKQFFKKK